MKLKGQTAIVVGGGKGLGRVIALTLADEGADVVVVSRTKSRLDEVAQSIRERGRRGIAIAADLTDEKQVESMVEEVLRQCGKIDLLVNSAGFSGPTAPVVDISTSEYNAVIAINLTVPFLCCRAVLRQMIKQRGGSIVTVSGTVGKEGWALRGVLSAAKFGLVGLTQTMAMEAGPYNVRVNAVCPGGIQGDRHHLVMAERARALGTTPEAVEKELNDRTPLRRVVSPEEVARAIVFLASSDASAITGESLNVSAGYIMH